MRLIASLIAFAVALIAGPALAQQQTLDIPIPGRAPIASPTDKENLLYLDLSTGGRVIIWLRPDVAPMMVERVKTLARQHFYDGLAFHRVIDGFLAQGGDPKNDGTGGSALPNLKAEFNYLPHVRGAVSAARADDNDSANSQFFIVFQPRLSLDKKYTVFGRVIQGMDYVDAIHRGEPPQEPSRILHAYIAADTPPGYTPPPVPVAAPVDLGPAVTLPGAAPAVAKPTIKKPAAAPAVVKRGTKKPAARHK